MIAKLMLMLVVAASLPGCSGGKRSDRDVRRDQIRTDAAVTRNEIAPLVGNYVGQLQPLGSLPPMSATLELRVIEEPYAEDGEVDPVTMPKLGGSVTLPFGDQPSERAAYAIRKSNYDPGTGRLTLVVGNSVFDDLSLELSRSGGTFVGEWAAAAIAESGTARFASVIPSENEDSGVSESANPPSLSGQYSGNLTIVDGNERPAKMTISSKFLPPDAFGLTATLRLFVSDASSSEFVTFSFDDVQFHPILGTLTARSSTDTDVALEGTLYDGKFTGRWTSRFADGGNVVITRGE